MTTSEYSVGLMHKVAKAWARAGGTTTELNNFAEDEEAVSALIASRRGVTPVDGAPVESRDFPIWKILQIGGKSRDELLAALEADGSKVGDWAKDMMTKPGFVTSSEPVELDLVKTAVRDLGFPSGATTRQIWDRIKDCGGSLCPPSVGPHLRLAYGDQPKGEYLWVAMEQITDSDGYPGVFLVDHVGGERWLDGSGAGPGGWLPEDVIVFVRPRK